MAETVTEEPREMGSTWEWVVEKDGRGGTTAHRAWTPPKDEAARTAARIAWLERCWVPPAYLACTRESWQPKWKGQATPWPVEADAWNPAKKWAAVLRGDPDKGKTHLAVAMMVERARLAGGLEVQRGPDGAPIRFAFISIPAACRRMRAAYEAQDERTFLGRPVAEAYDEIATTFDLVVYDDIGGQSERGDWTDRVSGWIYDRHAVQKPTIVTLNPADGKALDKRAARRLGDGLWITF